MVDEDYDLVQNPSDLPLIPNLFQSLFCFAPIGPISNPSELEETEPFIYAPLPSHACHCLLKWLYQPMSTRLDLPQSLPLDCYVCICARHGSYGNYENVHPDGQKV